MEKKIIKVKFYVSTNYINSASEETVELEFDKDVSEEEMNKEINDCYQEWMHNELDMTWQIIEESN